MGEPMKHMMAIVSKAIFGRERDDEGNKLQVGSLWSTGAYHSTNKSISKKLTGDLYLVTVQDGELWLVAHLKSPTHDGKSWVAESNAVRIRDITREASALVFASGKGVNTDKMAMSLQTPRILADEDVALLGSSEAVHAAPTEGQKDDAVVWVLSHILKRSEDEIRNDDNRYAAFHWDDGLIDFDETAESLDWKNSRFRDDAGPAHGHWMWGRSDFDPLRTLISDTETDPASMLDISARALAEAQGAWLYFHQFCQLLREGRVKLDTPYVLGRIKSGDSLIATARALFRMDHDARKLDSDVAQFYEVDAEWEAMINGIEHPELRYHLGVFFQEADIARCFGACFESDLGLKSLSEKYQEVASWWMGEGQGECGLAKVLDDSVAAVPPPGGQEVLEFEPQLSDGEKPVESEDELPQFESLHHHFMNHQSLWAHKKHLKQFVAAIESSDPVAVIRGIQIVQPYCESILDEIVEVMKSDSHFRFAFPIWDIFATSMQRHYSGFALFQRGYCLLRLEAYKDSKRTHEEVLDLLAESPNPNLIGFCHNNYAVCCRHIGELDLAKKHIEIALETVGDNALVQATHGLVLFKLGDHDQAFEKIEIALKEGINIKPEREVSEHPRYRELCIKYRVPVRLKWD